MPVLINFKICDNAKECFGIETCPTGALSYDAEKESIVIDNDKCISCGQCERVCPIGAISVARNDEEYSKIKEEFEKDPRTIKDLFVDRYGASPLSEFFMIDSEEIKAKTTNDCITIIELYNDDSIQCLLNSIPIKELTKELPKETLFYKVESDNETLKKYKIKELPAILIFNKGEYIANIDGYYSLEEKDKLLSEISEKLREIY